MADDIEKFENAFESLSINRGNQHVRRRAPHQPCLLLAVIEMIEHGLINENRIYYEPRLLEHFDRYYDIVAVEDLKTKRRPYYPFVYLDGQDFWKLHLCFGISPLDTAQARDRLCRGGPRKVKETVDFVSLDARLYKMLRNDPAARHRLRSALIDKWLPRHTEELWASIQSASKWMMDRNQAGDQVDAEDLPATTEEQNIRWQKINPYRDRRFHDAVLKAYEYRCAATGWRFKTHDQTEDLLEAAHIIPLKENPDNRTQNGMALTPTVHRAMDAHLIAPGPDLIWHASSVIKKSAKKDAGSRWLADLDERPIRLPAKDCLRPAKSVLEWRMEQLK